MCNCCDLHPICDHEAPADAGLVTTFGTFQHEPFYATRIIGWRELPTPVRKAMDEALTPEEEQLIRKLSL